MAAESCGSRGASPPLLHQSSASGGAAGMRRKAEAYREVLRRIRGGPAADVRPGSDDELWAHFHSLPARYALDVNIERVEDILLHKRLLEEAREPMNGLVFDVRHSQIVTVDGSIEVDSATSVKQGEQDPQCSALASSDQRPLYEVIFACDDKPKLLSQLTSLLGELGLNIQEAHAFSTSDGYSLDIFVVDGWMYEIGGTWQIEHPYANAWRPCDDNPARPLMIWKHHNDCVFDNARLSVNSLVAKIRNEAALWARAGALGLRAILP